MRARDYVVERKQPGQQFSVPIGATDSREHASIIAEAALEIAEHTAQVVVLYRGRQVESYDRL